MTITGLEGKAKSLREPLLMAPPSPVATEHAQMTAQDGSAEEPVNLGYQHFGGRGEEAEGGGRASGMTVVELHAHGNQ